MPERDGPHQGPLLCQGRLILVIRPPGPTAQPARGEPNPRLSRPRNQAPTRVLHSLGPICGSRISAPTMIYTHVLNRSGRGVESPADPLAELPGPAGLPD